MRGHNICFFYAALTKISIIISKSPPLSRALYGSTIKGKNLLFQEQILSLRAALITIRRPASFCYRGWSGDAKVLAKLSVPGHPTTGA